MYSYLGINALNLDYGSRIRANVQENFKGVLILDVLNEGPAHLAKLKEIHQYSLILILMGTL